MNNSLSSSVYTTSYYIFSSSVVSNIDNFINSGSINYVRTCVAQSLFNPIYYCVDMSVGDCSYTFIWHNLKRR